MTLDDIKNQPPGVLDQLPVDVLAAMQAQAEQAASDAAGRSQSFYARAHGQSGQGKI